MSECLGVVLAGGRSSRFGADKFLHVVHGVEMGLRAIRILEPIVDRVVVVGRQEIPSSWGAESLFGRREGSGPLGAILDAADLDHPSRVVVVPCDMPNLTSSSMSRLLVAVDEPHVVASFANSPDLEEAQWLASCWRGDVLRDVISQFYEEGCRSVRGVARQVHHLLVDLPPDELANLNDPVTT